MTVSTPFGQVIRDAEGMRLEFVRTFPDPIDRVWAAITDPHELAKWYGTWRGDPSTGRIELASDEGAANSSGRRSWSAARRTGWRSCCPPRTGPGQFPSR